MLLRFKLLLSFFLTVTCITSAFSAPSSHLWALNDVSVLLPLPGSPQEIPLSPTTSALGGSLIPDKYFKMLPVLVADSPAFDANANLAAVSIRIDPCFPAVDLTHGPCKKQVRIVWQPLRFIHDSTIALDAAVHTFYEIDSENFELLLTQLSELNQSKSLSRSDSALQIHPQILSEGYNGSYWKKFKTILLNFVGQSNFSRMTFMTLEVPEKMWDFGGFDIIENKAYRMLIPRINSRTQSFINSNPPLEFAGGARPEPKTESENFKKIISRSENLTDSDFESLKTAAENVFKIDNPNLHSPNSIDCVSCHVAPAVNSWLNTKFPQFDFSKSEFRYNSKWNLKNTTGDIRPSHNVRAFGYLDSNPSISQRTINETAAVIEFLNTK